MNNVNGYENFKKMMGVFIISLMKEVDIEKLKEQKYYMEQSEFKYKMYHQYNEIIMSIDTLFLIERFISIDPPKDEHINNSNYLTYHIHNYLNEIYILKDRLDQYVELIFENYQLDSNKTMLLDLKGLIKQVVKDNLKNFTQHKTGVRSQHVHYKRFQDEELKWLATTTFLSSVTDDYQVEVLNASLIVKNKWTKTITENNEETIKLLDMYFDTISSIIAPTGKIILPEEFINPN